MNTRNWSIRSKIIFLLMVPLVTLVALWGFATSLTVPPALNLLNAQTVADDAGLPGEALVTALQRERALSVVYLGGGTTTAALDQQRARTDEVANTFRTRTGSARMQEAAGEFGRARIADVVHALEVLPAGRNFIDQRQMDRSGALGLYSGIIDAAFRMFAPLAALDDQELARESRTLIALGRARELLAQENALVAGAYAAGRFGPGEPSQITQLIGTQRFLYSEAVAELPPADRVTYQKLTERAPFVELRTMEDKLVAQAREGQPVPGRTEAWQSAYESVASGVRQFELDRSVAVAEQARPVAIGTFVRVGLAGILGLVAILVTLVVSIRLGRSLIGRLRRLRQAVLELADRKLPDVVGRLRRGETVDVAAETPPLRYGSDELGQLARAFTEVQRTAVQSAVDEADLRRGLSAVFLNVARRSQTLLHRQLSLLDAMERRTTDPEELRSLFRVDHLATRMRRHAEDLVILAGAAPGRGWRNPVPVVDVIRGAVSEVEDYARVHIVVVDDVAVAGRAVGAMIHLLAELIENATSFSPPDTQVHVTAQARADGYGVDIEDRGLGMSPAVLVEANERLANPPDFDPANSARLGLFVVAQLAARHGIKVTLSGSSRGGVTATVLLPGDLVEAGARPLDQPLRAAVEEQWSEQEQEARWADGAPTPPNGRHGRDDPDEPAPEFVPFEMPTAGRPPDSPPPAWPQPLTVVDQPAADPAIPAPRAAAEATEPELTPDGLPRRVRQASLARQLREPPAAEPPAEPVRREGRSPEQVRAMMSALQAGTVRGRGTGPGSAVADREEDA
jgi:signal transduction histidine kinase